MANRPIKISKLRLILRYYTQGVGSRRISLLLGLARNTIKRYIHRFITLSITYDDVLSLADKELANLFTSWSPPQHAKRFQGLHKLLPQISQQMTSGGNVTLLQLWEEYCSNDSTGYKYTQFCNHFKTWCKENKVSVINKRWYLPEIPEPEFKLLKQWRYSNDRRKWERSVVLLEVHKGTAIQKISHQIERPTDKVKNWISAYRKDGLKGLEKRPRKPNEKVVQITQRKKDNLIKLIHETPELHGINRTTWSLKTLSKAYLNKYGSKISITSIGEYIHAEGYRFRKAREVLTSPDPLFREKLDNITNILSQLRENERFFSVDEFGPFSIKMKGGRSLQKSGELKTFPQMQKSKGRLICTAALELSTNQVTHFYSEKKNTEEMIKLLEVLLIQYKGLDKIYFSWDAASWHASKKLYGKIAEVNKSAYIQLHCSPVVELAPLPSSAQFLNVIESVFSGLAKAVIHNSNYSCVQKCKTAIDLYFKERNEHFMKFPQNAGNKIWGKELQKPVFDITKNFKDPKWR